MGILYDTQTFSYPSILTHNLLDIDPSTPFQLHLLELLNPISLLVFLSLYNAPIFPRLIEIHHTTAQSFPLHSLSFSYNPDIYIQYKSYTLSSHPLIHFSSHLFDLPYFYLYFYSYLHSSIVISSLSKNFSVSLSLFFSLSLSLLLSL